MQAQLFSTQANSLPLRPNCRPLTPLSSLLCLPDKMEKIFKCPRILIKFVSFIDKFTILRNVEVSTPTAQSPPPESDLTTVTSV